MDKERATTRLFDAAMHEDVAGMQAAIHAGADVNARDHNQATALHHVAWSGSTDGARLLIEKGADTNAKDIDGRTPRTKAIVNGHFDIVILLENAAKQQGHATRVAGERKDKGPPQVGG